MHEWHAKYADADVVRTAPMIDGPVIFALGRTAMELFLPLPIAALLLWRLGFPSLVVPVLLVVLLPKARERLGRNRLEHFLWGMGARRLLRLARAVFGALGKRGGEDLPTPFTRGRCVRFGP